MYQIYCNSMNIFDTSFLLKLIIVWKVLTVQAWYNPNRLLDYNMYSSYYYGIVS